MGLPSGKHDHARHRHGQDRRHDRGKAPPRLRQGRDAGHGLIAALTLAAALAFGPAAATEVTLRLATYQADLSRKGPGLLLRDLRRGEDEQIAAALRIIAEAQADILLLTGIDHDAAGLALDALTRSIRGSGGPDYPHTLSLQPNRGVPTGLDLDGDGWRGGPGDTQGYAEFAGQNGMALLSRFPIGHERVTDLSALLWRDLPGGAATTVLTEDAAAVQRLSATGHWIVPVRIAPDRVLHVLAYYATPPVFDGPEDRNGLRNRDELALWTAVLDGLFGPAPDPPFALMGITNLDQEGGEGHRDAMRAFLSDPRLQDPLPRSPGHGTATVDWPDPVPGDLRVDYVLPSADLAVTGAGVLWPGPEDAPALLEAARQASAHRLVWVDVARH